MSRRVILDLPFSGIVPLFPLVLLLNWVSNFNPAAIKWLMWSAVGMMSNEGRTAEITRLEWEHCHDGSQELSASTIEL